MTQPRDFAGLPFVAGDVRGVRSWDVDRYGRLISPTYRTVWTPGENVAECKVEQGPAYARGGLLMPSLSSRYLNDVYYRAARDALGVSIYTTVDHASTSASSATHSGGLFNRKPKHEEAVEAKIPDPPKHAQAACQCGFYAYSNGYNDYAAEHRLTGVIQGYGETQLGTRGFKCATAKVLALYVPAVGDVNHDPQWVSDSQGAFTRVRTNYPDVEIFDDYGAMVSAFPVYDHTPTPDTDPDFWTRGI